MLYGLYEMQRAAAGPARALAWTHSWALRAPWNPVNETPGARTLAAMSDLFESITRFYGKPAWNLPYTSLNGLDIAVRPRVAFRDTWCDLIHFERDPDHLAEARAAGQRTRGTTADPRVLIVAPLSGHYATLLRGTVAAFLPDHEVYITDWADARMRPVWDGRFDLDDYIAYIRAMLSFLGPDSHVVSVCQPGPPVLAAIALMAEENSPDLPATMTYMGSPIDTRCSPTIPNRLAEERPFDWFRSNMIYSVPAPWPGTLRRVYPGFVQLASFMNLNWDRHVDAHWDFFNHLVEGDGDSVSRHREFYDEYLAVLDLTEEFYLSTIQRVFQEHHLATNRFYWRGRKVDLRAIERIGLMTVEGEKDDISGVGQTQAAHDLCSGIPAAMRVDYVQPGVGHYGVFNGRRFRLEIAPRMKAFIRARFDAERETEQRFARSGV